MRKLKTVILEIDKPEEEDIVNITEMLPGQIGQVVNGVAPTSNMGAIVMRTHSDHKKEVMNLSRIGHLRACWTWSDKDLCIPDIKVKLLPPGSTITLAIDEE